MIDDLLYIKAKIKKLLSLALSPNEHEARRAMAKAQELILKYKISDLGSSEPRKEVKSKKLKFWRGRDLTAEAWVLGSLANEYCCEYDTYYANYETGLIIFGSETDLEVAEAALRFAWSAFGSCWRQYYKALPNAKKSKRKDLRTTYCYGFLHGILTSNKQNREANALVLVVDEEVSQAKETHHRQMLVDLGIDPDRQVSTEVKSRKKPKSKKKEIDMDAYYSGYQSGRKSVNNEQLTIKTGSAL